MASHLEQLPPIRLNKNIERHRLILDALEVVDADGKTDKIRQLLVLGARAVMNQSQNKAIDEPESQSEPQADKDNLLDGLGG